MRIELQSTAVFGKSITVKREKAERDTELVVAHMKFAGAFFQRDQLDEICGLPIGWTTAYLYSDTGEPLVHWNVELLSSSASVTGSVRSVKNADPNSTVADITLAQASLTELSFSLTPNGALVAGHLAWPVAGDEAGDVEHLLGEECAIHWILQKPEQMDLLDSMRRNGVTSLTVERRTEAAA